jgi:hypothetical protein
MQHVTTDCASTGEEGSCSQSSLGVCIMGSRNALFFTAVFLALLILSVFPTPLRADDNWLPISPDDLALKDNPTSPGADAMIFYREDIVDASNIYVDGDNDQEYVRIKIFTQEGTKRANVEIPFFSDMEVTDVTGRTIRPDGTIVKFEGKVLESTITRKSGYKFLAKTFTLPDAQPGCIVEYKYRRQGAPQYLHNLEWIVSQDIFTREAHFTMKPYAGPTGYYAFWRPYNLPPDAAMKEEKADTYTMVVHNIQPIVDEPLMPSEETLESRVEFYYRDSNQNEPTDKFWTRQAKKWNGEFEHFINKNLTDEVAKTVSPNDPPEVKLQKLYARAQRIRNLDQEDEKTRKETKDESIKPNSNVADLLSHGYGHDSEINFLFAGLVRAAGFQAQEVRISPNNGQIFNPAAEDVRQLDDDLVWISTGAKEYYLDPAAKYFPFNLLPWYEQGCGGLRLDKPTAPIVTSVSSESDAIITRNADLSISADGTISGKVSVDFQGQDAAILRTDNRLEDETGQKKDLEDEIKNWLPSGATLKVISAGPWDQNSTPLHVEATVSIAGLGASAGSRMLLPIEVFDGRYTDVFAAEKRVNIIDFRYPYQEVDDIKFNVPAGYSFGSLPNPANLNAGAAIYSITATKQGNTMEVKRQFVMKATLFEAKYYGAIRSLFGKVKSSDSAQAILQTSPSVGN